VRRSGKDNQGEEKRGKEYWWRRLAPNSTLLNHTKRGKRVIIPTFI
jgi:hypothetical protein